MGKGVAKAVENIIKVIAPALIGMDPAAQQAIDDKMVQARRTASRRTSRPEMRLSGTAALCTEPREAPALRQR